MKPPYEVLAGENALALLARQGVGCIFLNEGVQGLLFLARCGAADALRRSRLAWVRRCALKGVKREVAKNLGS